MLPSYYYIFVDDVGPSDVLLRERAGKANGFGGGGDDVSHHLPTLGPQNPLRPSATIKGTPRISWGEIHSI